MKQYKPGDMFKVLGWTIILIKQDGNLWSCFSYTEKRYEVLLNDTIHDDNLFESDFISRCKND